MGRGWQAASWGGREGGRSGALAAAGWGSRPPSCVAVRAAGAEARPGLTGACPLPHPLAAPSVQRAAWRALALSLSSPSFPRLCNQGLTVSPLQNYEHLFKVNDKSVGGSFYLQSKVSTGAGQAGASSHWVSLTSGQFRAWQEKGARGSGGPLNCQSLPLVLCRPGPCVTLDRGPPAAMASKGQADLPTALQEAGAGPGEAGGTQPNCS